MSPSVKINLKTFIDLSKSLKNEFNFFSQIKPLAYLKKQYEQQKKNVLNFIFFNLGYIFYISG